MYVRARHTKESDSDKRLVVRLTKIGEPDRMLEFHPGGDGVRVVGSAARADVVLADAGVLPVHCYFERDGAEIWLSPAQGAGTLRVNYQPTVGRVKLAKRTIVEVGDARFQVEVLETEDSAPLHGLFGTEIIEPGRATNNAELAQTGRFNAQQALSDFPTSRWQTRSWGDHGIETADLPVVTPDEAATLEYHIQRPSKPETPAETGPRSAVRLPEFDQLTTTQRLPRLPVVAAPGSDSRPMAPSPCLAIESSQASARSIGQVAAAPDEHERTLPATSRPKSTLGPPAQERYGVAQASNESGERSSAQCFAPVSLAPPRAAEQPPAIPTAPATTRPEPRRDPIVADKKEYVRRYLTPRITQDARVVAVVTLIAALSVSAFIAQALRVWPHVKALSTVQTSRAPSRPTAARSSLTQLLAATAAAHEVK